MSAAVLALALGTALAVGALAFVLYPIFFGVSSQPARAAARPMTSPEAPEAGASRDLAIAALREIEFDRATGKLSDADYAELKAQYTREALLAMRAAGKAPAGTDAAVSDDVVEAAIVAWRAQHAECATCGPRPQTDALFCSTCGRYLRGTCDRCGSPVDEPRARFCRSCGHRLAAA